MLNHFLLLKADLLGSEDLSEDKESPPIVCFGSRNLSSNQSSGGRRANFASTHRRQLRLFSLEGRLHLALELFTHPMTESPLHIKTGRGSVCCAYLVHLFAFVCSCVLTRSKAVWNLHCRGCKRSSVGGGRVFLRRGNLPLVETLSPFSPSFRPFPSSSTCHLLLQLQLQLEVETTQTLD